MAIISFMIQAPGVDLIKLFLRHWRLRQYAKVFIPGKSFHPTHILVNKAKSDKHCEYFTQDCFTLTRKYVTTLKKCQGQRLRLILPEQRWQRENILIRVKPAKFLERYLQTARANVWNGTKMKLWNNYTKMVSDQVYYWSFTRNTHNNYN